jgi:serine/threonine protein kinase
MFCSRCGTEVQPSSKFCPTCGLDLTSVTQGGLSGTSQQAAPQDDTAAVREALKDEYELEKELGRGGMAIVYKARDKSLEREVAIKILPFSLSFDAEFVERFQREARTSAKLEHPNIIPIYRVGKSGRVIFFVMKFLRGKPLSNVIEARGALPVPEIKRLLIEAGRALGYAHKHGIVHRDIKPDNIMFDELGQAIVTDFGIAKAQSGARLTGTGMSIGTPHYMSPEQARAQNLDGRSDIYSLGVVGYQCLTGHVPFDGEDSFSIGYKHIMEELPTPPLETADQRDLFAVVQKMMAKKPEDRFQTAEELVVGLESSGGVASGLATEVATRPTEALTSPMGVAAIASAATTPLPRASASMGKPKGVEEPPPPPPAKPPAVRPPRPKPKPKRSKAPFIVAALLVLAGAGLGGYLWLGNKGAGTSTATDTTSHPQVLAANDTGAKPPAAKPESTVTPPATAQPQPQAQTAQPQTSQPQVSPPQTTPPQAKTPREARPRETLAARDRQPPREAPPARTTGAADCSGPTVSIANARKACWDSRPNPRSAALLPWPASCTGKPAPVSVMVHVSVTGDVIGTPTALRSPCVPFGQAAAAYTADMRFDPAKKNGQAVAAWTQVLVRPSAR